VKKVRLTSQSDALCQCPQRRMHCALALGAKPLIASWRNKPHLGPGWMGKRQPRQDTVIGVCLLPHPRCPDSGRPGV
jgi:hypothetical protein